MYYEILIALDNILSKPELYNFAIMDLEKILEIEERDLHTYGMKEIHNIKLWL